MTTATKELREKRAQIVAEARSIADLAHGENRNMTEEESSNFDKRMAEAESLKTEISRLDSLNEVEQDLKTIPSAPAIHTSREMRSEDRSEAYRAWLIAGSDRSPSSSQIDVAKRCGIDPFSRRMSLNLSARAQSLVASEGGDTVGDEAIRSIEEALLAHGGMRSVAQVIRTSTGADLPWPNFDDTAQKGEILGINTGANEQDLVFDQLVLGAFKYSSKMIKVPVELLQDSSINIAQVIGSALGTRIARITNEHFTTGGGTTEPNGMIPQATAISPVQTTLGAITFSELVDIEHSVDPAYRANARFMFNDATLKEIKKLEDDQGNPLFLPAISGRAPATILGYPYVINQEMADLDTVDARSIAFGDMSAYKIRDVREINLLRLDERFAEAHQVAFLAFSRHDGNLLDAGTNPVKVFVNAAS